MKISFKALSESILSFVLLQLLGKNELEERYYIGFAKTSGPFFRNSLDTFSTLATQGRFEPFKKFDIF